MSDFPRMLYHDDGRTAVVQDATAEETFGDGWSRTPGAAHRRPPIGSAPDMIAPVHPSNHDDLVERISDRVVEKLMAAGGRGRPPEPLAERGANRSGRQKSED